MDDRFYNAFLPPEVVVCGRRLRKFTVWHFFLLSAIGSPVVEDGDIQPEHLCAAIQLCRQEHGENGSIKPSLRDLWWKRKLTRNPDLFRKQVEYFYQWMHLHSQRPVYWRKSDGSIGNGPSGPRCLFLVGSLMRKASISKSDAWNTSLGEAQWMDICFAQLDGAPIHVIDEELMTDEPIDLSGMSDAQALAMFARDLPEHLVQASFDHWRDNVKGASHA